MWSEYMCYLFVYFSIIIFSFNVLVSPLVRFFIHPVGYCCMFLASISLLEKKKITITYNIDGGINGT